MISGIGALNAINRTCGHKVRYRSKSAASKAATATMHGCVYLCSVCGFWHLGHGRSTAPMKRRYSLSRW